MIKVNKESIITKDYIEVINEMFDYVNKKGLEAAFCDIYADDSLSHVIMRGGKYRDHDVQRLVSCIDEKYLNKICGFRENERQEYEFIYTNDEYEKDKAKYIAKKAAWCAKYGCN